MNNQDHKAIRRLVIDLIHDLGNGINNQIAKNIIDSQAIFGLTKLIDSYVKVNELDKNISEDERQLDSSVNSEEDLKIIELYNEEFLKMAPRAGFEPATKRLTAACSTTELPRNNA